MKFRHWPAYALGLVCATAIASHPITTEAPSAQAQAVAAGVTRGESTTGAMGVRQTGKQIEDRARQALALRHGLPKPPRIYPDHEIEREKVDNPDALPTPFSPPARIAAQSAQAKGATAPKTLSFGTSFTGATLADAGAFPPDTMGTIGPTQFFVFINGQLRTFNRSGVADGVINADPDTFFAPVMTPVGGAIKDSFTSDPQVRYDRLSGRWFISIIDVPCTNVTCSTTAANRWLLAVSDADSGKLSASTVWTMFFVTPNASDFCDYPTLAVDAQALYFSCTNFNTSGSYTGTAGVVVQKSSVTGAGPIFSTKFTLQTGAGEGPASPRGVDNYDAASNEGYFIGPSAAAFSRADIVRISNPGSAAPTASANILLTLPTTTSPNPVTHLGNTLATNGRLDSLDDRFFQAHMRNGRLWTAHNFRVGTTGVASTAAAARNAVRWYELTGIRSADNGGVPSVVESGTIFDSAATLAAARQFWIPSVMVSGQGHAAIGFSTAGTPNHIDAAYTNHLLTDAAGTTSAVTLYTASSTAYNPPSDTGGASGRRWGDYSYTSLDPNDDMTMWTIQDFCDATNSYGVRVARLAAPPPATPASASPASVAAGLASTSVTITGTQVSGSGFFDPGAGFPNRIAASVSGGVTVNSVTFNSPTSVTLDLNTSGASAGAKDVTVTNPDGQSLAGTGILTITAAAQPVDLSLTHSGSVNPAPINTAAGLTYTMKVTNASATVDATGVVAKETLGPGLVFNSFNSASPWSCSAAGSVVTCNLATLAHGANSTVNLVVNTGASGGSVDSTGNVSSANSDPAPSNNTRVVTTLLCDPAGVDSIAFGSAGFMTNEGVPIVIAVNRNGTSCSNATVHFATTSGGSAAAADFTATSGDFTWTPLQATKKTFTVSIANDTIYTGNRTVNLLLSSPSANATLTRATSTITIKEDDAPLTIGFSTGDQTVSEEGGVATVTATLTGPRTKDTTVPLAITGTANSAKDYTLSASSILIPAGSTSGSVTLTGLHDLLDEPAETVTVKMNPVSGVASAGTTTNVITFTDDDPTPTVSFDVAASTKSESKANAVTLVLSAVSGQDVTVNVSAAGGTATQGADYTINGSGIVTILAGATTATAVTIINDTAHESSETATFHIDGATNATPAGITSATLTITDNDP